MSWSNQPRCINSASIIVVGCSGPISARLWAYVRLYVDTDASVRSVSRSESG